MASLKQIQLLDSVTKRLTGLGMRMVSHTGHGAWASVADTRVCAVYPDGDRLPHYARDAELFVGTLEDIELWLNGVQWAFSYTALIGLDDGKKRLSLEDQERERQMLHALGTGQLPKLKR